MGNKAQHKIVKCLLVLGVSCLLGIPGMNAAQAAEEGFNEVGHVAAVTGRAYRILPSGERMMLRCGEALAQGDALVAGEWGTVSISLGDVYGQVSPLTDIRVGMAEDGTPEFRVIGGSLRVLDTRTDTSSPLRIVTEFAVATGAADDTEVFVVEHKNISFCAGAGDLIAHVIGGPTQVIAAGQCASMKRGDAMLAIAERPASIQLADASTCDMGTIIGSVDEHLLPTDVAAPPPPISRPLPRPDVPGVNPCHDPAGCVTFAAFAAPTPPTLGPSTPFEGPIPEIGGGTGFQGPLPF